MNSDNSIVIPLSKTGKYKGMYEAIVDYEDRDLAELSWHMVTRNGIENKYAQRCFCVNGKNKYQKMHRVIMEKIVNRPLVKGEDVDHINGDGLDNRRSNLRIANRSKNMGNGRLSNANTSGYKGAYWHKRWSRWSSYITVNYKRIFLGNYDTSLEAHKAYCKAALEYFGEFANFGSTSPFKPSDFED